MTHRWRLAVTVLAGLSTVALAIIFSFPSAAECVASGRVVDPTFRHCESADGYVQIREHVILHTPQVVLVAVFVGVVAFLVQRRWRRR